MMSQQHGNYLKIEEKMKELAEREKLIDFTVAERVKEKILKELSEISIFIDENGKKKVSQIAQQLNKVEEVKILNITKEINHFSWNNNNNNNENKNIMKPPDILDLSTY